MFSKYALSKNIVTADIKLARQRRVEQGQWGTYFGMMDFFPQTKVELSEMR